MREGERNGGGKRVREGERDGKRVERERHKETHREIREYIRLGNIWGKDF